jgi:hypothetical protein
MFGGWASELANKEEVCSRATLSVSRNLRALQIVEESGVGYLMQIMDMVTFRSRPRWCHWMYVNKGLAAVAMPISWPELRQDAGM